MFEEGIFHLEQNLCQKDRLSIYELTNLWICLKLKYVLATM